MNLPKAKNKKLINKQEFVKNAKKVRESFEEKVKYMYEKKIKNGDTLSSQLNYIS